MFRCFRFFIFLFLLPAALWPQEEMLLPVPLYIDGEYTGEITLKINGRILLQPRPLLDQLSSRLDPEKLAVTENRWDEDEWIPYETMAGSLIQVDFDETDLLLKVTIPPESRREKTLSLYRGQKPPVGQTVGPAQLSGVLNLEGWSRLEYEETGMGYRFGPDLTLNYSDYVLETRGGVQSDGDLFFLDHLRVVRDFPVLASRAEAGSLTYSADGFLRENMIGLSLYRQTVLDEDYSPVPDLGQTIFFAEPAEVEILINDRSVRKQFVPAGTWTINSFPLSQGANEVVIRWTDSQGEHRQSFFQIYDGGLLQKDEQDWGLSFGTDSWTTFNPALLFHFSRGLSHTLTTGMNTYYDWNDSFFSLGTPLMIASTLGTFQLDPYADITLAEGYAWGAALNHSYSRKKRERTYYSFGSSWGVRNQNYPAEQQRYSLRGYFSYSPLANLSFTPAVSWSYEAVQETTSLDFSVRVRRSSGDGSTVSADLGILLDDGAWSPKAALTYSASFPEIRQNFYARGDMSGKKMNLSWNRYNRTDAPRDYTLGASAVVPAETDERFTLTMNGGYIHPLFRLDMSQGFNAIFAEEETANSTTLSGGTALVYADGTMGWSRPFRGSFALIESDVGPLSVNPTSRGALLQVDGAEPGILTSLSPYRYNTLKIEPDELPVGSDINDYTFSLYPHYKTGILVKVEEKVFMYAGGTLTDREGRPLELLLGEIAPLDGGASEDGAGEFFTDEKGYFECYGLTPGKYLLTQRDWELTYIIEVTANDSGFCELGEVKPED